jgi:galactokinase/mevalonate kinase-like predicted kinase
MGAGGGGFLALWIDPQDKDKILTQLKDLIIVPIKVSDTGSEVVFNMNTRNGIL